MIVTLFPLNGGNGLFTDVPEDAVYAGDGGDDSVTHAAENGEGDFGNGGCYGVNGVDGADDDSPAHVALAVLDARGLHVGDGAEILPGCGVERADFLADYGVGLTDSLKAVTGDGACAAHTETGARERLTVNHAVGQAESLADRKRTAFGRNSRISSLADIRIDGQVDGTVFSDGKVVVGETARLSGNLLCTTVDLWGKMDGDIYVKDILSLKSSSTVNGNIYVRKLQVMHNRTVDHLQYKINSLTHKLKNDQMPDIPANRRKSACNDMMLDERFYGAIPRFVISCDRYPATPVGSGTATYRFRIDYDCATPPFDPAQTAELFSAGKPSK